MSIKEPHAIKLLTALGYRDGDTVRLRAFAPERGKDGGRKSEFEFPYLPVTELAAWQQEQRGIYFVVNPGGHKDAEISECRALFYEHDDIEKHISQALWQSLGLPEPTVQVDTGGKSIHTYWALTEPLPPQEWRRLQSQLLDFANADRSLKNPSRVMRLAGCQHAGTGVYARIVGGTGKSVDVSLIKAVMPSEEQGIIPQMARQLTWTEFDSTFRLPCDESIPLDVCLSRDSRELLQSGARSNRNDNGAKLARDLIGTAQHLQGIGQRIDGDPYSLFLDYCQRCQQGDGWNQGEWDSVWRSAEANRPGPSVSPDKLENCIKAWVWKQQRPVATATQSTSTAPTEAHAFDEGASSLKDLVEQYQATDDPFNRAVIRGKAFTQFRVGDQAFTSLLNAADGKQQVKPLSVSDFSQAYFDEIEARAYGRVPPGLPCGLLALDAMTQGFQRSDLIVCAARPSMGKSALCCQIAANIAEYHDLPVIIYSLEMSKTQLLNRFWASESGIDGNRLRAGRVSDHEWPRLATAVNKITETPLFIDDTPILSVEDVERTAKDIKASEGDIGMIVIDYLQLMASDDDNRVYGLAKITRSLKTLARELQVPILILSQLSRAVEQRQNKRPMMSDLRDSGGIEQDCDLVMMLYREEYYDPDTPDRGIAELNIVKHRNGPTGTVKFLFEPSLTKFKNIRAAEAVA